MKRTIAIIGYLIGLSVTILGFGLGIAFFTYDTKEIAILIIALFTIVVGIAIIVILQRVTKVSIKGLLKEISDGSYDLTP